MCFAGALAALLQAVRSSLQQWNRSRGQMKVMATLLGSVLMGPAEQHHAEAVRCHIALLCLHSGSLKLATAPASSRGQLAAYTHTPTLRTP